MIVPRHKICDICKKSVGINNRYYIIKSKCTYVGYAGSASDNRKHHICEDCMASLISLKTRVEILESQMSGLVRQTSTDNERLQSKDKDIDIPKMCEECHSQSYYNGFDDGYNLGKKDAQTRIETEENTSDN